MHPQLTSAATLSAIVDGLLTAHPADEARIRRAIDLVPNVERTATVGLFLVYSATAADTAYRVTNGLCNCPDAASRDARTCKHAWAVKLAQTAPTLENVTDFPEQPAFGPEDHFELTTKGHAYLNTTLGA